MEIIQGNILDCTENIIVHQTNCMGVMGSGLAKQIKAKYPEVFSGYYYECKTNKAEDLIGTVLICEANDGKLIANVFGQIKYGKGLQTNYDALFKALKEVHDMALEKGLSVAIPARIGCGLAGGDWNKVYTEIQEIFKDIPTRIYDYNITSHNYEEHTNV